MSYHVALKPSGHEFQVADRESVLDAALREKGGVLPYGCRNGTCGSCMGTILSGAVVSIALSVRYAAPVGGTTSE